MSLFRKAINFDLSTKALKERFGENTASAYVQIKAFMLENGFEHRQYSGYASKEVMDNFKIEIITKKLSKKFPWLSSCIQEFDVTDIGEQYSLNHIFKKSISLDKSLSEENLRMKKEKDSLRKFKQKTKQESKDKGFEKEF